MAFDYWKMCLDSYNFLKAKLSISRELANLILVLKYDELSIKGGEGHKKIDLMIFDCLCRLKFMNIHIRNGCVIINAISRLMTHLLVVILPSRNYDAHCL